MTLDLSLHDVSHGGFLSLSVITKLTVFKMNKNSRKTLLDLAQKSESDDNMTVQEKIIPDAVIINSISGVNNVNLNQTR